MGLVSNVILFCGVLSIIYGAVGAFNQTKMKRLFAYSGVGHMGFILLGVGIGSFESIQASLIYMIIYTVMSVCVFSVLLSYIVRQGLKYGMLLFILSEVCFFFSFFWVFFHSILFSQYLICVDIRIIWWGRESRNIVRGLENVLGLMYVEFIW